MSRLWTAGFLVVSLLLVVRAFLGPFAIRSPLNLESFTFLLFACTIFSCTTPTRDLTEPRPEGAVVQCLCIAALTIAVYWRSIQTPFLFDDYTHLALARTETWSAVVSRSLLTHPQGGDYFFRPLGYLSYWLDYRWAGENPALWHGWNVLVHTVNSVLVYALCRTLLLRPLSSLIAAALFSVHASHVEVVCWMAARFDLLAFLFAVAALIALRRYVTTSRPAWLIVMVSACFLALLSKEAAFCLPLLAICLIPFDPQSYRRTLKSAGVLGIVCSVVFAYRMWFLGGIGGYRTSAGAPAILNFSLLRTAKALFYRQWAILSWPVNWSLDLSSFLKFGFILMVAASLLAIVYCRPKRAVFGACIAVVLAAALPAQQLLLIGADLSGARVLYLPTLGIALLWGVLFENSTKWRAGGLPAGGLLFFQIAALEHNMTIWKDVARLSHETCASFAQQIGSGEQTVRVRDLPRMRNGVFFLTNGFAECVGKPDRIIVDDVSQGEPQASFTWSDAANRIVPVDGSSPDKRK